MNITQLIAIVERRLVYLSQVKASAETLGDLAQSASIEAQIAETNDTLNKLNTLLP